MIVYLALLNTNANTKHTGWLLGRIWYHKEVHVIVKSGIHSEKPWNVIYDLIKVLTHISYNN